MTPPPLQEDTDSMQKELEMWKAENAKHSEAMKKEEGYVGVVVHWPCDTGYHTLHYQDHRTGTSPTQNRIGETGDEDIRTGQLEMQGGVGVDVRWCDVRW